MNELAVATGNKGKLEEIRELLTGIPVVVRSLSDLFLEKPDIPETGNTFLENASQKAQWVFSRKGIWTLADDSGLEVDFLRGEPGVLSARYSGPGSTDKRNNDKLLKNLEQCPEERRTARFRCVMVLMVSSRRSLVADGTCEGRIAREPHGEGGFGYDPLFVPLGHDRTFAQLDSATKHSLSHRGKAMQQMRKKIESLLSG